MDEIFPRHLSANLNEALQDTPVIFLNGPRQCGKSTLARHHFSDWPYFSLDDEKVRTAAQTDGGGFVRRLDRAIIDEVQRVPELMFAIKMSVDTDRRPGRFVLTGSANILTLPRASDSLAGRMEILNLLPLSQAEIERRDNTFLSYLVSEQWPATRAMVRGDAMIERVLTGGYPEMVLRGSERRRAAWINAYVQALIERDARDVMDIDKLDVLPRLLAVLAQYAGQLPNFTQIGGQLGLDSKTAQRYTALLEHLYLIKRLPPWGRNDLARLIKTPKLHMLDAGLQANLINLSKDQVIADKTRFGATLETWVFAELCKAMSLVPGTWTLSHFRDKNQVEVDFILENRLRQVAGIEVKASSSIKAADFKGLHRLQEMLGAQFLTGVVLYDGEHVLPFGPKLWAVPLGFL